MSFWVLLFGDDASGASSEQTSLRICLYTLKRLLHTVEDVVYWKQGISVSKRGTWGSMLHEPDGKVLEHWIILMMPHTYLIT